MTVCMQVGKFAGYSGITSSKAQCLFFVLKNTAAAHPSTEPGQCSVDSLFSKSQIRNSRSKDEKFCSFTTVYVHWRHLGSFQIQFQIQIRTSNLFRKHTEATCWRPKQLKVDFCVSFFKPISPSQTKQQLTNQSRNTHFP